MDKAMSTYGPIFAQIYDRRWSGFASEIAPVICEYYERHPVSQVHKTVLDVCCGTGQLAYHFLASGYRVVGVDLSPAMLQCARQRVSGYMENGQALLLVADATAFAFEERFGLVVSTFDSINHLSGKKAVRGRFRSVSSALVPNGFFVFDLYTRFGLQQERDNIRVSDTKNLMLLARQVLYDDNQVIGKTTGFIHRGGGLYERFEETIAVMAFELDWIEKSLIELGFCNVHFASKSDLALPIQDPEMLERVFVIATKC